MNAISKLVPFRTASLSDEDRHRLFDETGNVQKDRVLMGQAALKAAWWIGGTGIVCMLTSAVTFTVLFPLKTRVVEYYTVNQNTGYVGPSVGAKDAPALFSDQVTEAALQTYVELRENYLFETDGIAFHRVTLMSTPEEQAHYKTMHDAPMAPSRALRERGFVQVDNFQFWPVGDGKAKTREYVLKFDRREMHAGQPIPLRGEPYTVQIAFQFHPEYPMATPDRRLNVTGLQVLSYRIHSDNPTVRTN